MADLFPPQNHYKPGQYDSKRRFISYWHQIHEIFELKPEHVLEVGVGSGFLTSYLRAAGVSVRTCDYDKNLKPDIISLASQISLPDTSFDMVVSFEVLEHMPYEESQKALREFLRIAKKAVVISVPDATRAFRIEIPIPWFGKYKKLLVLPKLRAPHFDPEPNGGHQWEIGTSGYSLAKIRSDIAALGFSIQKDYRVFEFPYHHFFVLTKKG